MNQYTFEGIGPRTKGSRTLNVIIETPAGSRSKFKFDEELGLFRLHKLLPVGAAFPFDFGFVPGTKGDDGDPLDVLVLVDEPTFTGWQAHEAPFAFEEEMRYTSGAARFLTGTPNVPAHFAATAGYDLIEEIGIERIRPNSVRQTQLLIDLADEAGFEVRSPRSPERRGGTVTVYVPDFPAVHRELTERQILCDFRPDAGIRLGPHFFTSDEELRFAIEQIGEILESGAHVRHLGAVAQH